MPSRHDQNRAEKKDRLIRAAVEAFSETGFDATTVSDIVRRAGMTPSTFYNYFRDKDALRDEMIETVAASILDALAAMRKKSARADEYVEMACRSLFGAMVLDRANATLLRRNLPLIRSLVDHKALKPVYETLRTDVQAVLNGAGRTETDGAYAAAVLRASAFELGVVLLSSSSPDVSGAVDFAVRTFRSSLQPLPDA